MGLFDNLFKSTAEGVNISKINWVALTNEAQLNEIITLSASKPVLIFKHSTSCGISRMALKSFERDFDLPETKIELYFLDLLRYRNLSNAVAAKFGVSHQSPQVLVIKNGEVIYDDSHYSITIEAIKKVL
ncbi:MAG: bacillithiol system redox-active protein YtxJ [Gelidibacter sp.]|nr:bacillithiol system redox-active protein YtxJ [Gelidibacter sp.]